MFKTASLNTWTLRANSFFVGDKRIEVVRERFVSLEPQLPFLYIPDSDFSKFREQLNNIIGTPICSYSDNVCKFQAPCSENTWKDKIGMKIRLFDAS